MYPILFKIGPLTIHTYGFMLALGVGFGLWFLYVQSKKQGLEAPKMLDMAFYTIIISLIGAFLRKVKVIPLSIGEKLRRWESAR